MSHKPILTFPLVVGRTMFGDELILRCWHPTRPLSATTDLPVKEAELEETIWWQLSLILSSRFDAIAKNTRYYANSQLYGHYRDRCKAAADQLEGTIKSIYLIRTQIGAGFFKSRAHALENMLSKLEAVATFRKKTDPTICNMREILNAAIAHYSQSTTPAAH